MKTRTRGNSSRRFQYPLGLSTELPVSSTMPDTNVLKEGNTGTGRLYSHCSSMEEPAMVFSTSVHAYRAPSSIASGSENPEASRNRQASSPLLPAKIPVSCMENFRKSLQNKGFPEKMSKILLSSWRNNTAKQYESAWKDWSSWCSKEKVNPFCTTIKRILSYWQICFICVDNIERSEFIVQQFLFFHISLEGAVVGQEPLVTKFMKGIFSLRSPEPRYFVTRDVNNVLQLLRS